MIRTIQAISSTLRGALVFATAICALLTFEIGHAADAQLREDIEMATQSTIQGYFDALGRGDGWQVWLAEDMTFTSFMSPAKRVNGKAAYLQATQRFYGSLRKVQLRQLLIDGDRACALTRYELQPANGAPAFTSDVAELFTVKDGRINSFEIYFDSAPFPK